MTGKKPPTGKPPPRRSRAASASRSAATPDPLDALDATRQARLDALREAAAPLREKNRALAAEREANAGPHAAQDREAIARRVQRLADASAAQDAATSETLPGAKEWAALPGLFLRVERILLAWNVKVLSVERIVAMAERIASAATMAAIEYEARSRLTEDAKREARRLLRLGDGAAIAERLRVLLRIDAALYSTLMRFAQDAAWRGGVETDGELAGWIAQALALFLDSQPEDKAAREARAAFVAEMQRRADTGPDGQALPPEHVRRIVIEPDRPSRGAPGRPALDILAADLAQAYEAATGRRAGFSDDGDAPAGSFRAFVAALDVVLPERIGEARRLRGLFAKRR